MCTWTKQYPDFFLPASVSHFLIISVRLFSTNRMYTTHVKVFACHFVLVSTGAHQVANPGFSKLTDLSRFLKPGRVPMGKT